MRFRYTIEPVSPADVQIIYTGDTTDLTKDTNLRDSIINTSGSVQAIYVIVSPYTLDNLGNEKCTGFNDTLYYEITPALLNRDYAKTFVFDTLNIRCRGDNSGVIYLNSIGGITAYPTYDFYDLDYYFEGSEEFGDSVYNLSVGTYNIHVEDWSGCKADTSITLNQPDSLWSELETSVDIVCAGETADIFITPHGGTYYQETGINYGYSLTWLGTGSYPGGEPFPDTLYGSSFGEYSWEVTDSNGCVTGDTVLIESGNVVIFIQPGETYGDGEYGISCYGYDDGEVEIQTNSPGNQTLIYILYDEWWNVIDTRTTTTPFQYFSPLAPGKYYGTVETPNSCVTIDSTILTEPDELIIVDTSISHYHTLYNVSCFYSADGWIQVDEVTGGHGNYGYAWKDDGESVPDTDILLENIDAGDYQVIVTDPIGCFDTMNITLVAPPEIIVVVDSSNVDCFSESTGFITLSASGGLGTLEYYWPQFDTYGPGLINLPAGTYNYRVTDSVNCRVIDSVRLEESPDIILNSTISDYNGVEVACYNGNDGWIDIESSGGTGNHDYSWEFNGVPFDTTGRIENLESGTYDLTITDELSCEHEETFILNEPNLIEYSGLVTDKICEDYGTVVSTITGGIPFEGNIYNVLWSNGSTTYNLEGLSPGIYQITVTDRNLCSIFDSVEVGEESPMVIEIFILDSVQCNGFSNGRLGVWLENHTEPLIYNWDQSGENNPTLENVSAGLYAVTITDAHECISEDTIVVPEPNKLESDVLVEDAHCYDSADATVMLGAIGGNGGYYYWWDNQPMEGNIVENQHAGEHQLHILDRKGCQVEDVVVINQPEQIEIFALEGDIVSPDCEYSINGEITVTVEGGTPPYLYNWPEFENNTNHVESLGVGEYIIVVTDNQNCVVDQLFTLENRLPACLDIPSAFSPNNDGLNDMWIILNPSNWDIPISELYPNMIIEVYDRHGQKRWVSQPGYNHSTESGWNGEDGTGNILPVDTYYYFIHLNNGTGLIIQDIVTIFR